MLQRKWKIDPDSFGQFMRTSATLYCGKTESDILDPSDFVEDDLFVFCLLKLIALLIHSSKFQIQNIRANTYYLYHKMASEISEFCLQKLLIIKNCYDDAKVYIYLYLNIIR